MVESLSKLAFLFRHGNTRKFTHSSRKSYTHELYENNHRQYQFPQSKNKPVMRSPSLGRRRWSSLHQKRQMKDQNRLQNTNSNGGVTKNTVSKPLNKHTVRSADAGYKPTTKSKLKQQSSAAQINPLLGRLKRTTDGMEAFIVLFQRLTADMDVFTLPYIKRELAKYKEEWLAMKLKLEEADVSCRRLKEEAEMQKLMHEEKLEELRGIHSVQMDRLNELHEREIEARCEVYGKKIHELEERFKSQEITLQSQFNETLRHIQKQAEEKLESILEETKNQVDMLKIENDSWKEKLIKESWKKLEQVEAKYKSKMENVESRYLSQLSEADAKAKKREELFLTSMSSSTKKRKQDDRESTKETECSNSENSSYGPKTDLQNMEDEVCSLRVVLDLKHSEIQDLRKQNEKLRKDVQDLPFVSQKLDSAQARIEDLNAQLQTKIENEKKLVRENRKLLETVQHESEKKKRLTFQNEELLWKLKKSAQVAKTLAVFNNNVRKEKDDLAVESEENHSTPRNRKSCKCQLRFSEKALSKQLKRSHTDADIKLADSPNGSGGDSSPKVLGVVEKNDSVSWVLEIDESPLAVASRMLRRASSLRGVPSSAKKKSGRTQHSLTLPSRSKKPTTAYRNASPSKTVVENGETSTLDTKAQTANVTSSTKKDDNGKDNENVVVDISSFFAFLQDSDFETDLIVSDGVTNARGTSYSSTSSDCSLELDVYDQEGAKKSRRYTWTKCGGEGAQEGNEKERGRALTAYSSSISDTEESESVDIFLASPLKGGVLNEFFDSSKNSNE